MERHKNRILWAFRKSPIRNYRIFQRSIGVKRVRCSYFGARFSAALDDEIGFHLATGRFEYDDISRFIAACQHVRPHVFIDVGANIGVYSCIADVNKLAPEIIAFEPSSDNFADLTCHLAMNGLKSRVRPIKMAIGDHARVVSIVREDARNCGMIHVADATDGAENVSMRTLDQLGFPSGCPIVIKIDVEGHELNVLRGASGLFQANWGYAQIEAIGEQLQPVTDAMALLGWDRVDRHGLNAMFSRSPK